jgi:2-C-methyl-D-erythritol 4-phosphate cytidylyltransferase
LVAIHDAARPLVRAELLERLVQTVKQHRCGAIAAEKMIDSVCRTDAEFEITANVPREDLWRIQTPQVFLYSEICSAYARLGETSLTDDSAAARACGYPVMVVENPHPNLKLTTQSDLPLLHFLSKNV